MICSRASCDVLDDLLRDKCHFVATAPSWLHPTSTRNKIKIGKYSIYSTAYVYQLTGKVRLQNIAQIFFGKTRNELPGTKKASSTFELVVGEQVHKQLWARSFLFLSQLLTSLLSGCVKLYSLLHTEMQSPCTTQSVCTFKKNQMNKYYILSCTLTTAHQFMARADHWSTCNPKLNYRKSQNGERASGSKGWKRAYNVSFRELFVTGAGREWHCGIEALLCKKLSGR